MIKMSKQIDYDDMVEVSEFRDKIIALKFKLRGLITEVRDLSKQDKSNQEFVRLYIVNNLDALTSAEYGNFSMDNWIDRMTRLIEDD